MYPDAGMFVLIRPTQTFYERITVGIYDPEIRVDFFGTRRRRSAVQNVECRGKRKQAESIAFLKLYNVLLTADKPRTGGS